MRLFATFLFFIFSGVSALAQGLAKPKLEVRRVGEGVYLHITYGTYQNSFVPSNGLIIDTGDGVVLVDTGWDTPDNTDNTRQLLRWVADSLRQPVRLCIVTHAHGDRVGGTAELRRAGVRVVSTPLTAQLAVKEGYGVPEALLPADTTFVVGRVPIRCYFPGEGHTRDNIVVWLPNQRILHGGCLVKSVATFGMGYLGEANTQEWVNSIRRVIKQFGTAKLVVPGHDEPSDARALAHTLRLVEKHNAGKR